MNSDVKCTPWWNQFLCQFMLLFDWWRAFKPGHGKVIAKNIYPQKNRFAGKPGSGFFYDAPEVYELTVQVCGQICYLVVDALFYGEVTEEMFVPVFYQQRRISKKVRIYNSHYPWDIDRISIHS